MQFLLIAIFAYSSQLIVAADPDIDSIGVQLNSNEHAGTDNLNLTLWWNHTVYSCTMNNLYVGSCDDCEWQWCHPTHIAEVCNGKYQILLDNSDTADAPIIDSIVVWLFQRHIYYHISGWCIHNESVTNGFTNIEDWELKGADNHCHGMRNFQTLCLDNEPDDCSFGKMMLYFDPEMQNATRMDSPLEDAANVTVENITCSPIGNPTIYPTESPIRSSSSEPTTHPSDFPTNIPTGNPSHITTGRRSPSSETTQPSPFPTYIPTRVPSYFPSKVTTSDPTSIPSSEPSIDPSQFPTNIPTGTPSKVPTKESELEIVEKAHAPTKTIIVNSDDDDTAESASAFELILIIVMVLMVLCVLSLLLIHIKYRKKKQPKPTQNAKDTRKLIHSSMQTNAVIECTNPQEYELHQIDPENVFGMTTKGLENDSESAEHSQNGCFETSGWTPKDNEHGTTLCDDDAESDASATCEGQNKDLLDASIVSDDIVRPGSTQKATSLGIALPESRRAPIAVTDR